MNLLARINKYPGLLRYSKKTTVLDFTHSSRKAWHLLRHIGAAAPVQHTAPKVTPNAIAMRLLSASKAKPTKKVCQKVRSELAKTILASPPESPISVPYLVTDIDLAWKITKAGKAAGVDGIFPELLKNLGPLARTWLASMFTYCHSTGVNSINLEKSKNHCNPETREAC